MGTVCECQFQTVQMSQKVSGVDEHVSEELLDSDENVLSIPIASVRRDLDGGGGKAHKR